MGSTKVYAVFEEFNDHWPHEDTRYYDRILPGYVYKTYEAALKKCIELADEVMEEWQDNYTYHVVELTLWEN